ncbi:Mitogen-activated protein kinase spk1 [Schizosaccharomyces pombe]|uniref:Mitogen-activated protein kinase spk1 n=1 Tax=Schizosaccharomyces pombe (strain 972 / ATCC 24843) TaxID=284812 RepID=SPK1_SCHPO|nr:MAP kinase Spk1 [Schizosaccharomyces pombe]P27638.1 RecName: Full=Mitogen-activated protein kinase spk1; Short=MAP kinase spk1; Short=MAPK [Schizosaccharomyces pombe 972h-]CAA40610.1 protein kinase [Schizosaccharomyces pombe]CAB11693.1 MAP kinase Spk1 [Schizosaccharomyces pombe]BAA06536.1 Protein Kinase [Schizosaccharomyces pombe]BAC54906.1 spk1 [Schizosaccharomyces pombe]BAC54907.1 spk1 [Schizosaccharomyces pombe]|eukprot:NP_594009.1 MAP kinase Spk1 [Schizosaccharomyces pombe]
MASATSTPTIADGNSNKESVATSRSPHTHDLNFELPEEYEMINLIGQGAYGVVCAALHKPSGLKVAVKKIHPFNHPVFCLRTLREIKLLRHFRHENIISILDILPPPSYQELEDVYIVQELMETDLYRVIRSQPLSDDHCQYFTYQILRALKAMHSAGVVHRDLKPSNLLLNANCDLKVADFGLARSTTAQGGNPGFMTEYVATRWYRAPEIMLSFREYSKAIDLWSTGCILAEMLSARPLFPGKDYHSQITLILNILGTPTMDDFSRIKSARARKYIKSLPFTPKVSFKALFPQASPDAIDLLEKLLTFNPDKRITAEEALKHPYVAAYHDASDEPTASPMPPNLVDLYCNKEDLEIPVLKALIFREVNFR